MADYDSALPIRGNVLDGDTKYAENTLLVIAGTDVGGTTYEAINVDSGGRLRVVGAVDDGEPTVSSPVWIAGQFETNGGGAVDSGEVTALALDAYGRVICVGQVADGSAIIANAYPVLMAGQDGTNVQSLLTDTLGRLQVVVGGGTKAAHAYNSTNLVKDTPATIVSLAGGANGQNITRVYCSGSGLTKFELKYGVTGSEVVIAVQFNSTANPNVMWDFTADAYNIPTGSTMLVSATNLENRASPASDFTGYGTIVSEVPTA